MGHSTPNIAAIFDMDGVLIDSVKLNWQAINQVLGQYGVNVPDAQIRKYLGRTLKDQVAQFNDDFSLELDYDKFDNATNALKATLFAAITPKDGVKNLLEDLHAIGIPIALATSMPKDLTKQRMKTADLLQYFDAIVTEEDVKRHKPDPEVFATAAQRLSVKPLRCVVFEDAPAGVAAAKSAGMKCIAVQTQYVPPEALSHADILIRSLGDITLADLEHLAVS